MFSKQSVKEKMCKNLDRKSLYMCSVSFDCKVIELPTRNQKLVQAKGSFPIEKATKLGN